MFARFRSLRQALAACAVTAAGLLPTLDGPWAYAQELPPALPVPEGVVLDEEQGDGEHLLRGPMHEAFAAPVTFEVGPGLVVPLAPPEPINELPPDIRPEGDAVWLEGYWGWDDEREQFIWVSGVYRVPPVGRRWVPGHWQEAEGGFRWHSGFWAPLEEDELTYLPDPPQTLEQGPTSLAPSEEHFWVNGHWNYVGNSYAWRPGYWARGHEQWVWMPAHYVWTPRGCIFVPGYWDYRLIDRGMAFAPVYWHRPVYRYAGFYYRPVRMIDLARLHLHMFVRPRYHHYYYGDWYGPSRFGIYASFSFHGRYGYDPLWSYHHWYFGRQGIDYAARVRGWHVYFERHVDRRPPHTWYAQRQFAERHRGYEHLNRVALGHDLREYASRNPRRVTHVPEPERQRMHDSGRAMRELSDARRSAERDARPGDDRTRRPDTELARLRLPETSDVRQRREQPSERIPSGRRPPDTRSEDRPGARPGGEARPSLRPDARPTPQPEARPTPQVEARPTLRPEGRPETRPTPRPEARPTPQVEARPTPQPEARPTPRPEGRPETRPTPRPEARPTPQPTPRFEARPTPQPAPRPEARPTPQPAPRPEARPTPQPTPRFEARSAPGHESRPAPPSRSGSEGRGGGAPPSRDRGRSGR